MAAPVRFHAGDKFLRVLPYGLRDGGELFVGQHGFFFALDLLDILHSPVRVSERHVFGGFQRFIRAVVEQGEVRAVKQRVLVLFIGEFEFFVGLFKFIGKHVEVIFFRFIKDFAQIFRAHGRGRLDGKGSVNPHSRLDQTEFSRRQSLYIRVVGILRLEVFQPRVQQNAAVRYDFDFKPRAVERRGKARVYFGEDFSLFVRGLTRNRNVDRGVSSVTNP